MNSLPTIPSRTVTNLETVGVVRSKIHENVALPLKYTILKITDMFKYNSNNNVLT